MSTEQNKPNDLVVPAGEAIPVGGLYLAQPDGSLARQGDQSTCLASIARGAVRPVIPSAMAETTDTSSTMSTDTTATEPAAAPTTKPRRA